MCRCHHTGNLEPLSADLGVRERLFSVTSQASGGCICVVVDTQEGFRLSCQLQTRGALVLRLLTACEREKERLVMG